MKNEDDENNATENARMRERSGWVRSTNPFVAVFYDLLKLHVHAADLEELVRSACAHAHEDVLYTNGYLAEYAQDLVVRLTEAHKNATKTLDAILLERYHGALRQAGLSSHDVFREIIHTVLTGQYTHGRPS
jgi:hypothetical protein